MLTFNLLVGTCLAYVVLLFVVAWMADRRARQGRLGWLRSPLVYTLSLSIYCTAWTFYGAVGYAARSGLEFVTIYLGPTLVMIGWWTILRRLVRIGRAERITSIADLVSSRFGKSTTLGVFVTVLAVLGTTPYIALQLQSVTLSFAVFLGEGDPATQLRAVAFWVAAGLAVFTIVFGTRNLDVNERHHGVVMAIALEAVVKLIALLAVGIFVVFFLAGGVGQAMEVVAASPVETRALQPARWSVLIFLSAAAFICLPRMFQVMVVENADEGHLRTASWAFPLYLFLMSLFVIPIAAIGLTLDPGGNPDLFVLTVPLSQGRDGLAMLAFLGGFSSATSMVIVAAIALSTMVSNHIVMPLWLSLRREGAMVSGDVRDIVLLSRRLSIGAVLGLGYLYYRMSGGSSALASIGLVAFTGVAQVLPSLLGGLYWRGATRTGAAAGLATGCAVWLWTSFLPSFGEGAVLTAATFAEGPFGIAILRPQALFGIEGLDPLVHAVFWSMILNAIVFCAVSLVTFPSPIERLQGAAHVNVFRGAEGARGWSGGAATAEDLLVMAQRILGSREAQDLFSREATGQGKSGYLPDVTPDFLDRLERALAGSVGSATAHAMVAQITGGVSVSVQDLMRVADEAQQILEYSSQLEAKSEELERTARQLRLANEKLMDLGVQKDAFLSQISHELRTPMTSIRSFSEILMADDEVDPVERQRYARIMHGEARRLTRLLDDLLDLSVLENGQVVLNRDEARLGDIIDRAVTATEARSATTMRIERVTRDEDVTIVTDEDRLLQVFVNLISNARKYCTADEPVLRIAVDCDSRDLRVDFIDNGDGIPPRSESLIFEKFARVSDDRRAGGAGLGLAICREIMQRLGGAISYLPGQGGAAFRVTIPVDAERKAA